MLVCLGMAGLDELLREMVEHSEYSRYRISMETGVSQAQLSRFVHGQQTISIETAEVLAEFFGMEVVLRPTRSKGGK